MSLWKKIASRVLGHREAEGPGSPGMTYADFERDKERKERQLSGAGLGPPGEERSDSRER
jgi:hypothetical protein